MHPEFYCFFQVVGRFGVPGTDTFVQSDTSIVCCVAVARVPLWDRGNLTGGRVKTCGNRVDEDFLW